jgi:vancomycin resistance protein YoaR
VYQRNYSRNKKSRPGNRLSRKIIISIFALIFTLFIIYSLDLLMHWGKIYPNVVAIDQKIGKMNKIQANQILTPLVEKLISRPIIVEHNGSEISLIPKEKLGASINVEQLVNEAYSIARRGTLGHRLKERISLIRQDYQVSDLLKFDKNSLDSFFVQLQSQVEQPPRDAVLDSYRIIPAKIGITIDQSKLLEEMQESIVYSEDIASSDRFILPVNYLQPDITTNELLAQIGVHQALSSYETSLQGKEENTLYNIHKASREINGVILKPGESFSFNQWIGPAEREDGYKESTIIANGQFVNGYGGGVCQVSTTLYNAVLLANLQIIERYNHSVYGDATSYVPLGRDAAIFYGYKDLKFRNSLDQKVVLFCEVKGSKLTATIFGESSLDKNIKIITQDEKIHDYDIIEIKQENNGNSKNMILQEGVPGYSIKTYRIVIDSQGESMELISQDQYISIPMKVYAK